MEHPAESKREWYAATVLTVHRDAWEIDVRALYGSAGRIRRVKVLGPFLPEPETDVLDSKVVVGWLDSYQQSPVAIPIHNTMVPDAEKANHVFWSQHLAYLIRITRDGQLEIRNTKGPLLQVRVLEADGVVRLDTPKTHLVLKDADGSIEVQCEGDAKLDAGGDVDVTAGGSLSAKAAVEVDVEAPIMRIKAQVFIDGGLTVNGNIAAVGAPPNGNITASGAVTDTTGNTNHHSH